MLYNIIVFNNDYPQFGLHIKLDVVGRDDTFYQFRIQAYKFSSILAEKIWADSSAHSTTVYNIRENYTLTLFIIYLKFLITLFMEEPQ